MKAGRRVQGAGWGITVNGERPPTTGIGNGATTNNKRKKCRRGLRDERNVAVVRVQVVGEENPGTPGVSNPTTENKMGTRHNTNEEYRA